MRSLFDHLMLLAVMQLPLAVAAYMATGNNNAYVFMLGGAVQMLAIGIIGRGYLAARAWYAKKIMFRD